VNVLLSTDLGPQHEALFGVAVNWVTRMQARLDILYVLPFTPLPTLRDPALREAINRELREDNTQRQLLTELMGRVPDPLRGAIHTRNGNPADEILGMAEDFDALLVGTSGKTGVERFWLGSVAEKVVRKSPVPVLVLPLRGLTQ
jgi:nucleotide-binding universal stress UspA family protein